MIAEELLAIVRDETGRSDVAYAERPARLGGGFFTENLSFSLAGAPTPWDQRLVVRLFPSAAPTDLARREAAIQRVLAAQGYPAPNVVWFDDDARLDGRRFFVMQRLPGHPMLGSLRVAELARSGWQLAVRLPSLTASLQAWLHRLDVTPLLDQIGDMPAGIERWFVQLEEQARSEFDGLQAGLRWLVAHQPARPARRTLCHGDLWAGNILTTGKDVTGVLDYSVATVAEPSLDVGFTAMSLCVAPTSAARPVQRAVARLGRVMSGRYVRAYQRETGADLSNQRYYEALRCIIELSEVASYRIANARGEPHDIPKPTWVAVAEEMVTYFHARTGVTVDLPPAPRKTGNHRLA